MCVPSNSGQGRSRSYVKGISILFTCIALNGCASNPNPGQPLSTQEVENARLEVPASAMPENPIVHIAHELEGAPYRYGGVTPQGFDCSGFVHYVYRSADISIPRTTRDQYRSARKVALEQARPGDLLFFRISSRKLSHVGLYIGDGRFIHASTSKKQVIESSLNDGYWKVRLDKVGRIQ